jgi:hypothetical protein
MAPRPRRQTAPCVQRNKTRKYNDFWLDAKKGKKERKDGTEKKKTYVGKDTHHIEGTTREVIKVDVGLQTTLGTQEDHVTNSVDSGPTNNGSTQPSVEGHDL